MIKENRISVHNVSQKKTTADDYRRYSSEDAIQEMRMIVSPVVGGIVGTTLGAKDGASVGSPGSGVGRKVMG